MTRFNPMVMIPVHHHFDEASKVKGFEESQASLNFKTCANVALQPRCDSKTGAAY